MKDRKNCSRKSLIKPIISFFIFLILVLGFGSKFVKDAEAFSDLSIKNQNESVSYLLAKFEPTKEVFVYIFDDVYCSINSKDVYSLKRLKYRLYQCLYKVKEKTDLSIDRTYVYVYRLSNLKEPKKYFFTKKKLTFSQYLREYFRDYEVVGINDLSIIEMPLLEIIPISFDFIETVARENSFSIKINQDEKKIFFFRSAKNDRSRSKSEIYYGLFYRFKDLNLDFYDLMKGYFSQVQFIFYRPEKAYYLLISKRAISREQCVKTFVYLKSLLDDKWQKAQKLGDFFPRNERKNLQVLYKALSDVEIRPFRPQEIELASISILKPLGLERYYEKLPLSEKSFSEKEEKIFKNKKAKKELLTESEAENKELSKRKKEKTQETIEEIEKILPQPKKENQKKDQ